MSDNKKQNAFETLDPNDWQAYRKLMHEMVDDAVDFVANIGDKPPWQQVPDKVMDSFSTSMPHKGVNPEDMYAEFKENIMAYPMGNVHPRFWAWYMGAGNMAGVMGDFWASVLNPNLGGGNHAANMVEAQVVNWMKEMMNFPPSSSGLLVSGGSMANFVGLTVARNVQAGYDIRKEGLIHPEAKQMLVYASKEIHSCNQKAVELLGLGTKGLRKIPVNKDYTININLLIDQIIKDRADGFLPIAVIGTSGTINTGAIDDLDALADICAAENLWFHIDGSIGALAILSEIGKKQLSGLDRADSLAIDLHKMLHMPFEAACVLVKDAEQHKEAFSLIPEYLEKKSRGLAAGNLWFSEYGLQLSRRFKALKIWMSLKEHGSEKFGRIINRNILQAQYVERLVIQNAQLEMLAPVGLDIICFRFIDDRLNEDQMNQVNQEIKILLEERGIAAPGYTTLGSKFALRYAIGNHRTTDEDLAIVTESIVSIGNELTAKL